jgi:hypothetical protein
MPRTPSDWAATFDSCFELYGGAQAAEELEQLSSECAHICNRCAWLAVMSERFVLCTGDDDNLASSGQLPAVWSNHRLAFAHTQLLQMHLGNQQYRGSTVAAEPCEPA